MYKLNKKLPQFKNTDELDEYMKSKNIEVEMNQVEEFGYSLPNYININRFLPRSYRLYVVVHELAHIITQTTNKTRNITKINADILAVDALRLIDEDEQDLFTFKELLESSYFTKIKPLLK